METPIHHQLFTNFTNFTNFSTCHKSPTFTFLKAPKALRGTTAWFSGAAGGGTASSPYPREVSTEVSKEGGRKMASSMATNTKKWPHKATGRMKSIEDFVHGLNMVE